MSKVLSFLFCAISEEGFRRTKASGIDCKRSGNRNPEPDPDSGVVVVVVRRRECVFGRCASSGEWINPAGCFGAHVRTGSVPGSGL